ncbi:TIGR02300 family protein [Methylobacterium symbioticum]|jgi:uncharacterized protein (TIGR02300 family)|uniref:TIGR02300 family protein n=1 Tax=Methylobacterium symbioticum TaxID=2584084 RepID=A0A509E8H9_9HYPH|nr:TIGR02300 family protein [Methylobacterium symbioticum]VUD69799.1 hypothetical protein MET9862_00358 [Methylobacterium symbioticum]
MDQSERGTKRICPTTGRKFYDLNRDPVISPYTGEVVPTAVAAAYGRGAPPAFSRKPVVDEEEPETEGPELVSLDEVEAEEADTARDSDTESDDLNVEDDAESSDDDTLIEDEDDDSATDLVDVENDDED